MIPAEIVATEGISCVGSEILCGYPIPKREEFVLRVTFIDSTGILLRRQGKQIITKEFS